MVSAWRIVMRDRAASAFTGEGARLYGGRWNSLGVAMSYAAESRALAALEMLVHLDWAEAVGEFALVEMQCPAELIENAPATLPADWASFPAPLALAAMGDYWVANGMRPVLRVPSVVIPQEWNYLVNPRHAGFARIKFGKPVAFDVDGRLRTRQRAIAGNSQKR